MGSGQSHARPGSALKTPEGPVTPEPPGRGRVRLRGKFGEPGYDRHIVRIPFLVSALLALAAIGTVVGALFYLGLISTPAGGVAAGSQTPRGSITAPSV